MSSWLVLSLMMLMVIVVGSFLTVKHIYPDMRLILRYRTIVDYELSPPKKLDYDYIDWLERQLGVGKYDNALLADQEYEFEYESDYDPEMLNAQPVDDSWEFVRFKVSEKSEGQDGIIGPVTKKRVRQLYGKWMK